MFKKIVAALDVKDGRVVKSVKGVDFRDAGDPAEAAAYYCKDGADEIVLLDITATIENRGTLIELVEKTAKHTTVPLAVAGGVRTAEDAKAIIGAGAARVSIGSAAIKRPELLDEIAKQFGSKSLVSAVDVKRGTDGRDLVCINGGHTLTEVDAVKWAVECEARGAGEILLTSFDADGTRKGYDLVLTKKVSELCKVPVTASGGAGSLEDIYDGLTVGGAQNALVASLLHFKTFTVRQIKEYLAGKGINVDMSMY